MTDTLLHPTEKATMLLNLHTTIEDAIEVSERIADCEGTNVDYSPYTAILTNIFTALSSLASKNPSVASDPDVIEALEALNHDLNLGGSPRD